MKRGPVLVGAAVVVALGVALVVRITDRSQARTKLPATTSPVTVAQATAGTPATGNATATATAVPPALADELARLLAIAEPEDRFGRLDTFWRRWFAVDRDAVFTAIAGLPASESRTQALTYALMELAATEPERALDYALRLVRERSEADVFAGLFDRFARQDLARAREQLARVPAGVGFEPAWRAFADCYARANLTEALHWAQALPDSTARSLALETAVYTQSEKDPFAAFDVALRQLSGEARDRSLYQALIQIIPTDPAGAATLIAGMPASPSRELAVVAAARAWADDGPGKALAWAAALPQDAAGAAIVATANVLEVWAQRDAPAAQSALAALPEGEARAAAAERVAAVLVRQSPGQALDWALTLSDGPSQDRALATAIATWARQDPAQAAAWTLASGAGEERGALLGDVISHWALQDLPAAKRYVATLDDSAAQTRAAAALIPYLAPGDPRGALAWAESLPNATARNDAVRLAYRAWLAEDPMAARAWAASPAAPRDL